MITERAGEGEEGLLNKWFETELQQIAMVIYNSSFRYMKFNKGMFASFLLRENYKPRQKKVYMVHMPLHDQIISWLHSRFLQHLEARRPKNQQKKLNCSKLIHHLRLRNIL
jgi:hypothetical protein